MSFSRRSFLLSSAVGTAGLVASQSGLPAATPSDEAPSLVFAHLTDMHIKPSGAGPAGLVRCLRHVHQHPEKPSFILNGGDVIMSALGASEQGTRGQWEIYQEIMQAECRLPMKHCIGNHDCWGWQRSRAGTTGEEPLYGKKWAMQELAITETYYAEDIGGWRLIVLDSVQERGDGGYLPVIDDAQFDWLTATLESTPVEMPTMIVSHVPILSVTPYFFSDEMVVNYQFRVSGALMHQDVQKIVHMLRRFPQVKVCMSGHSHLVDDVVFEGKTYLCNGAVSGSWWHGPHKGCQPGYALVKLWRDGSFQRDYIEYDKA